MWTGLTNLPRLPRVYRSPLWPVRAVRFGLMELQPLLVGFFEGGGRVYVGVSLVGAAFCAGDPAMLFKALELLAQRTFGAAGGMHYLLDGVGIPFQVARPKQSKDVLRDLGIPLREVLPFPVPDLLKAFENFLVGPFEGGGDSGSFLADSDITA